MATNLKTYFIQRRKENPNTNIAGYIGNKNNPKGGIIKTFWWCSRASTSNLPAAAYIADYIQSNGWNLRTTDIYTNLSAGHWITTYFSNIKTFNQVNVDVDELVNLDGFNGRALVLTLFSGYNQVSTPLPGGGLYQAALDGLNSSVENRAKLVGQAKGLNRALRYYMLAAYSLLGLCKQQSYSGGNYVAALLVNDYGQIIAYGINNGKATGSFHHAEVNMLLDYFSRNPTQNSFPGKSIVFSTLTPCQQCTQYLKDAKPDQSLVFFGQMDTGEMGSVGADSFDAVDVITKPVRGSEWNQGKLNHFQIASGLQSCMTSRSVAGQIGNNKPAAYLRVALNHLERKNEKDRDEGNEEQRLKKQVMDYLFAWVESVRNDCF